MKLFNQSIKYLSSSILVIITAWAVVFYFNMLNEIKDSIDEGLENYKRLIIQNASQDSTILEQHAFDENFFSIQKRSKKQAFSIRDRYIDTLLYMQDDDDKETEAEPVRMLITAFELKGQYYELKVANSMVEEDDLIESLLHDTIWLYVSLIIGIILINNFVLKKLWKPFYALLNQLKNFRLGKTQALPSVKTKTKEFTDLQNVVNVLLQHTTQTYEQQKQFIGNASHELQTPLAIATNKLELLIEKGDLQNEQAENIAEVMGIIERLVRLNKSLLLLTKIENKQFLDNQTVSLNEIVRKNVSDLEEIALFKNVKFYVNETAQLSVQMDASLANVIISNLLRNAIFHNIPNGSVTLLITDKAVKISNTGSGQMLDKNLTFTRFYKPNNQTSGTGLGLAIVKAISDAYNFKVSYSFENSQHCFQIFFR
ncbi:MAG: HAMP domain-containing histidine kinase [Sphingobacteriales bacterium]|jgi:two-component system sensor histidine kinase QseC|nr:HAMP domain-containing histidine kinase [Sphingobacteriales bacterium]MDA0198350.1 HAMP domain-containing sensor histidine kinase [Bacteroidota bacterium]MBK6891208.1 HAMP domain-containing histidine kinase [Sphingobacteriales bacterium]MBK7526967.1 HAMP domain-containing histidine kinase [Sphingobacteriales bacterium]MBK8677456.1 HAMP domain-containing histidine kinase [Sphingobacteriales bacterium]